MAWSKAPVFGPVATVTIACSVMPVLSLRHTSTPVSFSGTLISGCSTSTTGTVEVINVYYDVLEGTREWERGGERERERERELEEVEGASLKLGDILQCLHVIV